MEIEVKREDLGIDSSCRLGGGYAVCILQVRIDKNLPIREQRIIVIHEILENYCPSWEHSKVDDLTDLISEGLDQLEELVSQ